MNPSHGVECSLSCLYSIVRADLEEKFRKDACNVGIAIEDLVGTAYTYVCAGVLTAKVKVPESGADLYRLISHKAALLVKDAARSSSCGRGRKSLRARQSLDDVLGDGNRTLMDYASYQRYMDVCREDEKVFCRQIAVQTLHKVFEKIGMTKVNRSIYLECVMEERPRELVAQKYGTTRNNTDAIVARVKRALAKYGPGIFAILCREAA